MKTTVRCTQLFCKCGTPIRACRHAVIEPARQMTAGSDKVTARDIRIAEIGEVSAADLRAASITMDRRNLEPAARAEFPDFAILLAEKSQAMIAAFDLLSDETWASIPENIWQQIQTAADELQLALFHYHTKGAGG
jgi:hypothetical protein